MKRFIALFALVGLLSAYPFSSLQAASNAQPINDKPANPAKGKLIPDQYIVVLKDSASTQSVTDTIGIEATHVYQAALKGFTAKLDAKQLAQLRNHPQVDFIEQDQEVSISATQYNPPWGLDRIDQRNLPLSGSYTTGSLGINVTAYIIDTGIDANHWDFGGRAANVYDAFGGNGSDCNGHGTQ